MPSHPVRHQELLLLRPMIVALRQPDYLLAKRLAMSLTRILFMRCSVANMAIYNDQRGAILRRLKDAKSSLQHLQVIDISHARHIPAIGDETRSYILAKGQTGPAFNANAVVIVDRAQVGEFEMPSKGSCLTADPFHHAPISAECVDVVMKQFEARALEVLGQPAARHGEPDPSAESLTECNSGRSN